MHPPDLLARIFHQFDTTPYFSGSPVEQLHCLNEAAEFVQLTDKIEKRVMALVKRLKAAYDICSGSDAFTDTEREMISNALQSDGGNRKNKLRFPHHRY
jgi:type I restriction enzyme R subunit